MALQVYYRDIQDGGAWPEFVTSFNEVPEGAQVATLYREKNSHRGIGSRTEIVKLCAKQVNQVFLDEIGQLTRLEYLDIETITAEDLSPIASLENLKTLKLDSVRKASDFSPLLQLSNLDRLFIQHAKHLNSAELFSEANHLISLGLEGSMWTAQVIDSLAPLKGLKKLEALFFTNVRLKDKSLSYLAGIPNLKVLECARFAPKIEFVKLRKLMPELECHWCDDFEINV